MAGAIGKLPDGLRPPPRLRRGEILTPHGRGGSVSRRDLIQAYRRPTALAWARNSQRTDEPIPSCFPGGSAREGPFSERPPPSHSSHRFHSSGGGPGEGKDSHSRQWRLSMAVFLNRNKRPSAAPIEVAEASLREAASPGVSPTPPSSIREGARGRGLFYRKVPSLANSSQSLPIFFHFGIVG